MPDSRRVRCRRCGKSREEVGPISWRGLCSDDAKRAVRDNVDDLYYHRGEGLARWRLGMARAAGAVLLDADEPDS